MSKLIATLKYWRDVSECSCFYAFPQGGCFRCDMDKAAQEAEKLEQQRDRLAEDMEYIRATCQDKTIELHPDATAKGCVDECLECAEKALAAVKGDTKDDQPWTNNVITQPITEGEAP